MSKSKEIRKCVIFENFGGNPGASCFRPICHCKANIQELTRIFFLSHNLVKHYVSTILQKEVIRNVAKKSEYVRGSESREPTKETTYIYF
jgi:hypothetical protein